MKRILYIMAVVMLCTAVSVDASAKKRKTTKKSKKVTAVVTPTVTSVSLDSLMGKAYEGVIGQTVVDFFGTRNVYGNVTQNMYIAADPSAADLKYVIIHQLNGVEEQYIIEPLNYADGILTVGDYRYQTLTDGTLSLQSMTVNSEQRKGILKQVSADAIMRVAYKHGKHLSGMSIQTDEDKRNARLLLALANEANVEDAREFFVTYNTRLAEKGDPEAIRCLYLIALSSNNYDEAHRYIDSLITLDASNPVLLADKGMIYIQQGKKSDAKKTWKKLRKAAADFANTSEHPFCKAMR